MSSHTRLPRCRLVYDMSAGHTDIEVGPSCIGIEDDPMLNVLVLLAAAQERRGPRTDVT